MAETNTVTLNQILTINQILDTTAAPGATSKTIRHDAYNTAATLNADSTPAVTKSAVNAVALTAGALTLDLTALVGTNGATVTGLGLRVQTLKIRNKSTNTAVIVVAAGASNGWDGLGALAGLSIPVGGDITAYIPEAGSDIAAGKKNIDITSSDTDAVVEYAIAMG